MDAKTLKSIVKLTKRIDGVEIDKAELKDNDLYFTYKNGAKKKLGHLSVSAVAWGGNGETPTGDFATKNWVYSKDYAPKSWVEDGYLEKTALDEYAKKTDLDGYATEEWVSEQIPDLDGYATESWVEAKGYVDETYHDSTKSDTGHTHVSADITDLSIPKKTSDLTNDSGFITANDIPTIPEKTSQLTNDSGFITLSDIPTIPTKTSELTNDSGFIDDTYHDSTKADASSVYTKSETDGLLNNKANLVHTHTVSDITDFPTNVSSFNNDVGYITNEKFFYVPITTTPSTTVKWDELYQAYDDDKVIIAQIDYTQSGITIPLNATLYGVLGNASAGTMMFTFLMGTHSISYTVTGTGSNTCTVTIQEQELELLSNKVQSVVSNNTSTTKYASTKAVFDEFQRKPVVVWQETTPANYLAGINADISASPAWQLTNLDLTPYKRIKIYSCAGRKSSGVGIDASTTPAIVLEMSLDTRNAIADYGGNYISSVVVQKPNDANRLATLTCAVSADKTSFVVLRQTSLYGTGATSNADANANVFMIEGYYD